MAESLSKQAYQRIRRMILTLELPPGAVVNEAELIRRLRIGRTPIREALQRLASEHFVSVVPRKGMFVAVLEMDELPMLFETRAVLEPYAARLAARNGKDAHWKRMDSVLARADGTTTAKRLLDIDRHCHEIMWEAAGNRFLTGTLDALYAQSERTWHIYLSGVEDMAGAVAEHRELLDILRNGDGDRAADLLAHHVAGFMDKITSSRTPEP